MILCFFIVSQLRDTLILPFLTVSQPCESMIKGMVRVSQHCDTLILVFAAVSQPRESIIKGMAGVSGAIVRTLIFVIFKIGVIFCVLGELFASLR
jgi:hypothetical protein